MYVTCERGRCCGALIPNYSDDELVDLEHSNGEVNLAFGREDVLNGAKNYLLEC